MSQRSDGVLIELDRLSKAYREGGRELVVLDRIDGEIRLGELVVLLGKSGSGKTTLLNLISGIDLPTAGRVVIDGVSIGELTERERTLFRRRRIGFVFQFFNLLPTLTVEENLLLPLELLGPIDEASRAKVRELLLAVGLEDRAKSFPDRLSGGERQRVAIARALIHDPDLLLADEPTGNLDLETAAEVLSLLDRLIRQQGKTLVVATHSRSALRIADRVFRVEHGGLIAQEPRVEP